MKRHVGIAALVMMFTSGPVIAEDVHTGAGANSCGKWIAASDGKAGDVTKLVMRSMMLSWVQGFLTGAAMSPIGEENAARAVALRHIPDSDAVEAWLDKYCRENPLEAVLKGAIQLQFELQRR